ncbi:hypothetical protein DPMN_044753 [Dreissena polymorpha]|uniref:Uncharacterized protein n=1 Tax=Dreissena polymorpha TaxID=45954 RepID=A0A9D4D563_DREPO|nr:hypothetical protein DPMN_044753 [Dreissena polymorpha]
MTLTSWVAPAVNFDQDLGNRLYERAGAYTGWRSARRVEDNGEQHDQRQCRHRHERKCLLRKNPVKARSVVPE